MVETTVVNIYGEFKMKYCKLCLQPDTRPNTKFTEDRICPACNYFRDLQYVDWQERYEILEDLLEQYPRRSGQYFDCIIGVSGGKDSLRQALLLRDKFNLRPLLVSCAYPPEQVTIRGVNNLSNLIEHGFDVLVSAPAPETSRRLMRESFYRFGNQARATELALFSSVPQAALRYQIPLVFWGENPALQVGDLGTLGRTGYDGNQLRNLNTLTSGTDWMLNQGFSNAELIPYKYPDLAAFESGGIQIVYLGWFLGDWSLVNNASYSCADGLEIREQSVEFTSDLYGVTALDEDWVILNQVMKYYKYGFGRVSDYVNEEIRLGRMTRERGAEIVEKYDDSRGDEYVASFCRYIGISVDEFRNHVLRNVNRDLFEVGPDGSIHRRFKVGVGL